MIDLTNEEASIIQDWSTANAEPVNPVLISLLDRILLERGMADYMEISMPMEYPDELADKITQILHYYGPQTTG